MHKIKICADRHYDRTILHHFNTVLETFYHKAQYSVVCFPYVFQSLMIHFNWHNAAKTDGKLRNISINNFWHIHAMQ